MMEEVAISASGSSLEHCAHQLISCYEFPEEAPDLFDVPWKSNATREDVLSSKPQGKFLIQWEDFSFAALEGKPEILKINGQAQRRELRNKLLEELDFELATLSSPHKFSWPGYNPPSFSDFHFAHGWACAFRGKGHDRLVSRRWLKYAGPWLLIRNEERDVSFVQFHSLDADAETALEQAKPGHQRMGISHTGGFIQTSFVYRYDWDGIYLPEDQILEIVVHGREVEQREMLEACALRHYQPLGDDQPLANVRYVFMTEESARTHLRELWLRELECWAIVDGQKVRLDEDYNPGPPEKPEWVKEVEARG